MSWPFAISNVSTPAIFYFPSRADALPGTVEKKEPVESHCYEDVPEPRSKPLLELAQGSAFALQKPMERESDPYIIFYSGLASSLVLKEPLHLRKELGKKFKSEELMAMVAFISDNEDLKKKFWNSLADFEAGKYNSPTYINHSDASRQMLAAAFNDKQMVKNFMEVASKAPRKTEGLFAHFLTDMNKSHKAEWRKTLKKFRFSASLFAVLLARAGDFFDENLIIDVAKREKSRALPSFKKFLEKFQPTLDKI